MVDCNDVKYFRISTYLDDNALDSCHSNCFLHRSSVCRTAAQEPEGLKSLRNYSPEGYLFYISSSQLEKNQGIEECVKGSRRRKNYGYGELLAAGIYESDGETPVKMGTKVNINAFEVTL